MIVQWFKKLFSNGSVAPAPIPVKEEVKEEIKEEPKLDDLTIFKAGEMLIYTYDKGGEIVKADPMVLFKRMAEKIMELDVDIKVALSGMKDSDVAYNKALEKIRWIFEVQPFDGTKGLTEVETFKLLDHFIYFTDSTKKNLSQSQT